MTTVSLYFENGLMLEAKSFGARGTSVGEIVFNTSLTGYQEIVTDPSYAGQFVTFTMPEIGNVGCNAQDMESKGAYCKGIIVRSTKIDLLALDVKRHLLHYLKKMLYLVFVK